MIKWIIYIGIGFFAFLIFEETLQFIIRRLTRTKKPKKEKTIRQSTQQTNQTQQSRQKEKHFS